MSPQVARTGLGRAVNYTRWAVNHYADALRVITAEYDDEEFVAEATHVAHVLELVAQRVATDARGERRGSA